MATVQVAISHWGLGPDELRQMNLTAARAAFVDDARKAELAAVVAAWRPVAAPPAGCRRAPELTCGGEPEWKEVVSSDWTLLKTWARRSASVRRAAVFLAAMAVAAVHAGVGAQSVGLLPAGRVHAAAQISVAEFAAGLTAYYNSGRPHIQTGQAERQMLPGEHYIDLFVDTLTPDQLGCARGGCEVLGERRRGDEGLLWAGAVATQCSLSSRTWIHARFRVIFTIKGYEVGIYTQGRFTLSR